MAEVLSGTMDNLDQDNNANPTDDKPSATAPADAGPDSTSSPPPPPRRPNRDADRDSRERRDDRPPRRGYHDRNRSPPPPPPRERDYQKRGRPSPSPPHRHIETVAEEVHILLTLDGRPLSPLIREGETMGMTEGGSPRGGYGPGDRRFHGRYMGRPSAGYPGGPSDWDSGRAGFADTFGAGGAQREGMMSYKQFIQELEDDVLPAEAERRLKDKYHPTNLLAVIERRNEVARKSAKDFQLDLQSGTLDLGPGVMPSSLNKDQISEANSDDEADVGGKRRRHGRGGAKESDLSSAPKAHPVFSESRRIQVDVEQAQALVRKLDLELNNVYDNEWAETSLMQVQVAHLKN
ncbi:UNVERIFIED_CONTAM: Serrate RNA effector molecule [Sesamum angustifolium]|uniref:Serrate RNA effector molecule n=1 Tax=Sesamum angustifolium TaxID=2727405 RepID=A0AAW2QTG8_9LAMI